MQKYQRGENRTVLYRLLKTIGLFVCWICLGLWNEVQGPTLGDLRRLINANYEEISRVLSARSGGTLAGSVIGGVLHDRFKNKRDLFICLAMLMSGVGILVAPHCGSLWLMGIVFFVQGLGHGILTTGGNPTVIILWADLASGWLMFLHSGYGIGASLSPVLASPFLSRNKTINGSVTRQPMGDDVRSHVYPLTNGAGYPQPLHREDPFLDGFVVLNATVNGSSTIKTILTPTRIYIPYAIIGFICFFASVWFLVFFLIKMPDVFHKVLHSSKQTTKKMFSPEACTGGHRGFGIQMILMNFFFFFFVTGIQRAYGKFVYSYARNSALKFTQSDAALLNTLYWVSFTAARLIAFVVARWVPVHILLHIQVFGTAISAIFLDIFHDKRVVFWVFTSLFGFFQSPLYPSCIGFLNHYMEVTSMVIVIANIGSSAGGIVIQWFTGYLFQNHGPRSFLHTMVAYSVLIAVFFVFMHFVAHRHGERPKASEEASSSPKATDTKVHPLSDITKSDTT